MILKGEHVIVFNDDGSRNRAAKRSIPRVECKYGK